MMPSEFGPMSRTPPAAARARSSRSRAAPSAPISRKPAVITTAAFTPLRPHSSITSAAAAAGTVSTARSTGPGISSKWAYARRPSTDSAFGFTGYSGPGKRARIKLSSIT